MTSDATKPTAPSPAQAWPGGYAYDPRVGNPICDALHLYRICPNETCQRARACRGLGGLCIRRHANIVPPEVWEWVAEILRARDRGLSHEEIMEEIEPHKGAFFGWIAGVEAGLAARRPRRREAADPQSFQGLARAPG
jgi:hypothetical protein